MWKKINALLSSAVGGLKVFMCGCICVLVTQKDYFDIFSIFFFPLNFTLPFEYCKNCVKVTSRVGMRGQSYVSFMRQGIHIGGNNLLLFLSYEVVGKKEKVGSKERGPHSFVIFDTSSRFVK